MNKSVWMHYNKQIRQLSFGYLLRKVVLHKMVCSNTGQRKLTVLALAHSGTGFLDHQRRLAIVLLHQSPRAGHGAGRTLSPFYSLETSAIDLSQPLLVSYNRDSRNLPAFAPQHLL